MSLIGSTSLGWGDASLREVFQNLSEIGAECVELNAKPGHHGGLTLDDETIPRARAWADEAGLEIVSVAGYNDFAQTDRAALQPEVERLLDACRIASALGVPLVRAFVGDAKPGVTLESAWPAFVEGFQLALPEAERLGVTLAAENHGRLLNDGPTLVRLVEEVGSPSLRITIDTGNFCWAGHNLEQAKADYAAVLPHVVNVHIKDGVWHDGGFAFVPAGDGELPLTDLFADLAAQGYDGAVCSEFEGAGDFREGTQRGIAYLKAVSREP
ncbi:MAG: sugar phosphate isomerase/epimerase family protein [Thermomicrobiales bacterium]